METTEKKSQKVKIYTLISVIISLVVIFLILKLTIDSNTFAYLSQTHIRYEFFLAAALLSIICWFIWGARLKILSNAIDKTVHIGWWESTKIVIANLFLAGITPSLAGGEPVRIFLLKEDGMTLGCATAVVLGERLIDAIFILICIPFALFVLKDRIEMGLIRTGVLIGVAVFILCIILFVYAIYRPEKVKSFLIYIEKKLARLRRKKEKKEQTGFAQKIGYEVDHFHESMMFFVRDGKLVFFIGGLLTVAYWFTGFMIPSFILWGLGIEHSIVLSFAAQMLLLIIVMLPTTPGSSGVTEGGMAGLYSIFIGSSLLGVFVLLFRFITYHMNLIAGGIFQYRIFKSITSFSWETVEKHREHEKK